MAPVVEKVCEAVTLGEGPHWDAASQTLYYVDIEGKKLFKYDPASKQRTAVTLDDLVGFAVPVEGRPNEFVAGLKRRLVTVTWDGRPAESPDVVENLAVVSKDSAEPLLRINDGKADPTGRLWAGTMSRIEEGAKDGVLFFVEDRQPHVQQTEVGLSNGLAWTPDAKTMYYIDSLKKSVDVMDMDPASGKISNRRVLFDLPTNGVTGFPDGMAIDVEGKLWVAVYGGARVIRVDPSSGALLAAVDIPAPEVTSVAFGGAGLDELYVTTAAVTLTREARERYPDAGALFRVKGLGVKGYAGRAARL